MFQKSLTYASMCTAFGQTQLRYAGESYTGWFTQGITMSVPHPGMEAFSPKAWPTSKLTF